MELHYVYDSNVDTNDPILRKILEFCNGRDISVKLREFDSHTNDEDKDYITHLPALNIYVRGVYQDTIYPDFKPIQFLSLEYEKFQLKELEMESKKQIWEARIKHLKSIFRLLKTDSEASNISR